MEQTPASGNVLDSITSTLCKRQAPRAKGLRSRCQPAPSHPNLQAGLPCRRASLLPGPEGGAESLKSWCHLCLSSGPLGKAQSPSLSFLSCKMGCCHRPCFVAGGPQSEMATCAELCPLNAEHRAGRPGQSLARVAAGSSTSFSSPAHKGGFP